MNSVRSMGLQNTNKKGQYRHPMVQQYVHRKGHHEVELIKKTCQCPHAYHTNTFTAYQPSHNSCLSSVKTIAQNQQWREQFCPKQQQVTNEQTREDFKVARMLDVLTKARPSQNIRDLHRYRCGYGPCVIIQKDILLLSSADECQLCFLAFSELMRELEITRKLSNPCLVRQRQCRLQHLAHTEGELEAERNCLEFDDHTE